MTSYAVLTGPLAPLQPAWHPGDLLATLAPLGRTANEATGFAYLDPAWRLLGLRIAHGYGPSAIDVRPRDVAADALAWGAAAVVMAHSHPSGDVRPSMADCATTRAVARALAAIEVLLVDHLILAGDRMTSFRRAGLM